MNIPLKIRVNQKIKTKSIIMSALFFSLPRKEKLSKMEV